MKTQRHRKGERERRMRQILREAAKLAIRTGNSYRLMLSDDSFLDPTSAIRLIKESA